MNGLCRWCGAPSANFRLTWHTYCFNAYRVATGLKPVQIQKTLCVRCGGPPVDLDHELSIVVARALGEAALLRAFTLPNLRWLCKGCHRRKTRLDRRLEHYARPCDLNWRAALGLGRAPQGLVPCISDYLKPLSPPGRRSRSAETLWAMLGTATVQSVIVSGVKRGAKPIYRPGATPPLVPNHNRSPNVGGFMPPMRASSLPHSSQMSASSPTDGVAQ